MAEGGDLWVAIQCNKDAIRRKELRHARKHARQGLCVSIQYFYRGQGVCDIAGPDAATRKGGTCDTTGHGHDTVPSTRPGRSARAACVVGERPA